MFFLSVIEWFIFQAIFVTLGFENNNEIYYDLDH